MTTTIKINPTSIRWSHCSEVTVTKRGTDHVYIDKQYHDGHSVEVLVLLSELNSDGGPQKLTDLDMWALAQAGITRG